MLSGCLSWLPELLRALPPGGASVSFSRAARRWLLGAAIVAGCACATALAPRGALALAVGDFADQRRLPLVLAAFCAALVPGATAAAWRSVLTSCGQPLTFREAWCCYGLGSLANTFLPGRLGDGIRIELFSRRLRHEHQRWLACGVSATVGLGQSLVLGLVLSLGAVAGALPLWALVLAFALPAALWGGGRLALRRQPWDRAACLATASTLSMPAWGRLLGWLALGAAARLLLAAGVLEALAVPDPLLNAVLAIASRAAGNALPFAPGGAGIGSIAIAVGLERAGIDASTAIAAGFTFHALEICAALLFAATGWLALRAAQPRPTNRPTRRARGGVAITTSRVTNTRRRRDRQTAGTG